MGQSRNYPWKIGSSDTLLYAVADSSLAINGENIPI